MTGTSFVWRCLSSGSAGPPGARPRSACAGRAFRSCRWRCGETEPQHLVRAVAAEHIVRRKPICVRDGAAKRQGRGVGVEVEAGDFLAAERVQHAGRGGKGAFVGVELDVLAALGLLARHIGVKPGERGNEKIAHERPSMRTATALACASSPSRWAKRNYGNAKHVVI